MNCVKITDLLWTGRDRLERVLVDLTRHSNHESFDSCVLYGGYFCRQLIHIVGRLAVGDHDRYVGVVGSIPGQPKHPGPHQSQPTRRIRVTPGVGDIVYRTQQGRIVEKPGKGENDDEI